jgi:hypothetical protein
LKTAVPYGKALGKLYNSLDEDQLYTLRKEIYESFFLAAPAGQDFFKQSNTRLHFIADRALLMTQELFQDPVKMVDDISALGLRHVGYGIPTELFAPFVNSIIEVLGNYSNDHNTIEAYRWSLSLISNMLVRTITEGSTIVMKAINANSVKLLNKAIAVAARGERANTMLIVQVGSQSISPLEWAIESGSLDAAKAIIEDLLTFRADRERYYYGMEQLFSRHPDIIKIVCANAPTLLSSLLDGLIWRSRNATDGLRRVNYYVKYLMVTKDGGVSQALLWFWQSDDCKTISHPVNVLVSDTMWKGIVRRHFLSGRLWFIMSLIIFLVCQSILPKLATNADEDKYIRIMVFAGRVITYGGSMLRLVLRHTKKTSWSYYHRHLIWKGWFPFPKYLSDPYDMGSFLLMLLLMAMSTREPMLYCLESNAFPTWECAEAADKEYMYAVFSMIAMVLHWVLIVDMAVFSTKLSAFLLVCTTVLGEVGRFMIALGFLLLTFGSAIACLRRDHPDFRDVPNSTVSLFAITLVLMPRDYRELQYDPPLLFAIFLFVTASVILLLNLLIAQLNCSYEFIYQDMVGFARLNRAQVIVESLQTCSKVRWDRFVRSLKLDQRVEFNEGDKGIPGAIQLNEPASLNPITTEQILRYGGTCSPEMRWPEDKRTDNKDRFERMESLVKKAMRKVNKMTNTGHGSSGNAGGSGSFNELSGSGLGGGSDSESEMSDQKESL